MSSTKILVTGATGFIGRYLLEQLARNDSLDVTVIVRPGTAGDWLRAAGGSRITYVPADLTNPYSVRLPFGEYDALINLVGPRSSQKMAQWETNVEYVRNLLVLLRHVSVNRIVHFSSVSAYGLPGGSLPVTESSNLSPSDWYGMTKVLGEAMLEDFHNETRVPVVILRPSWVVGHGSHLLDNALFRAFSSGVRIVMRLGTPLNIVYVRDVADVAIQAALSPQTGLRSYIINTTQPWSFDDLLREIDRATVRPKVPLVVPRRAVAIMAKRFGSLRLILSNVVFCPRRAMDELGFAPRYDLAAIVRETLALRAADKTAP